jgi:hypothetical protein
MYRTLRFHSAWPNEWVFDALENPVAPGARALAECIVVELRKQLPSATDVFQHSFYGWAFRTEFEHAGFYHVLNPVNDAYLTVDYERYWLDCLLMKRPNRRFDRYLSLLTDVLNGTPKVSDVHSVCMMRKYARSIAEPSALPNGGPATPYGSSRVTEGPPSVS